CHLVWSRLAIEPETVSGRAARRHETVDGHLPGAVAVPCSRLHDDSDGGRTDCGAFTGAQGVASGSDRGTTLRIERALWGDSTELTSAHASTNPRLPPMRPD